MNVVTWNMQGAVPSARSKWETGVRNLFLAGAEVVCLQECCPPPDEAIPAAPPPWLDGPHDDAEVAGRYLLWCLGDRRQPLYVLIFWVGSDADGRGVNLAVATTFAPVSPDGTRAPAQRLFVANPHEFGRPAIGLRLPYNGASLDLYSVHALLPGGHDAPGLLDGIYHVGAPWFAAGDFNRRPSEWHDLPMNLALCPHNGELLQPGRSTNTSYAFICPAPAARGAIFHGFIGSEHSPIVYVL
ncbi:MAG: endonuclease/exonuclease/phosphatase family protein [Opitutae bacterium]|nr:endonuclease/exonuclease/phosphatase family protein [Opitutae bacterium]